MATKQRGRADEQPAVEESERPQQSRPHHEIRLGRIKAAIWANDGEHGVRHSVTVCRIYKDRDDRWQTTLSFGRDDLLLVAKVLDLAHTWIMDAARNDDVPF